MPSQAHRCAVANGEGESKSDELGPYQHVRFRKEQMVAATATHPCCKHSIIICRYPLNNSESGDEPEDDGESGSDKQGNCHGQYLMPSVLVRGDVVSHGGRVCRTADELVQSQSLQDTDSQSILNSFIAGSWDVWWRGGWAVRGKTSDILFLRSRRTSGWDGPSIDEPISRAFGGDTSLDGEW